MTEDIVIKINVVILILLCFFTITLGILAQSTSTINQGAVDALQSLQIDNNKTSILAVTLKLDILQNTQNDIKVEMSNLKGIGVGFGSCFVVLQGLMVFFQIKKNKV